MSRDATVLPRSAEPLTWREVVGRLTYAVVDIPASDLSAPVVGDVRSFLVKRGAETVRVYALRGRAEHYTEMDASLRPADVRRAIEAEMPELVVECSSSVRLARDVVAALADLVDGVIDTDGGLLGDEDEFITSESLRAAT